MIERYDTNRVSRIRSYLDLTHFAEASLKCYHAEREADPMTFRISLWKPDVKKSDPGFTPEPVLSVSNG
jgi:hypothetical protein